MTQFFGPYRKVVFLGQIAHVDRGKLVVPLCYAHRQVPHLQINDKIVPILVCKCGNDQFLSRATVVKFCSSSAYLLEFLIILTVQVFFSNIQL